jgi:lysophospholipase L1-like esterase
MKNYKFYLSALFWIVITSFTVDYAYQDKVKVLLIGDSTTIGGKGVFETTIEKIINKNTETPSVEVINSAKGGETAYSVLESGRYDSDIKPLEEMDYIFVRYGINDFFKRKPVEENFPKDYKVLISKLKADFPTAKIILTSIIPFFKNEEDSKLINDMVKRLAKEENLEFFDVYPLYKKGLETHGENAMSVRFIPLSDIPEDYKEVAVPYARYVPWKGTEMVRVLSSELDPIFGDVEGWYRDRHPNPMGYRLLAYETVNYLWPELKKNPKSLPLSSGVALLKDEITNLEVPTEVKAGENVKISFTFSTTQKRDLRVFLQLNKAPWTTFYTETKTVENTSKTEEFTLKIPKDIKPGNDYKIGVNILPVGKGWPDRLDEKFVNGVNISE